MGHHAHLNPQSKITKSYHHKTLVTPARDPKQCEGAKGYETGGGDDDDDDDEDDSRQMTST